MAGRILAVLIAAVIGAGCGGQGEQSERAETLERAGGAPVVGGSGGLVDIGGGRRLYLRCVGSGSPAVVLEAAFPGTSDDWRDVQDDLGRTALVCAYDRAGLGKSPAIGGVRDAGDEIEDLQRLLRAAHIDPPYVLVGHAYGGLLARLFAHAHPRETAGMVLVDARGRDATRRQLRLWPASEEPDERAELSRPVRDGVDFAAGEALAARVRSLDATPLAVISAGRHDGEWGRLLSPRVAGAFDRLWARMQDELAALSTDHVHVVALRSDHFVQRLDGQPGVVIRAVQAVVGAARKRTRLPPCRRLFTGPDVRCRR